MKFPEGLKVYGDPTYRNKKCPTESAEQITFFNVLRAKYPDIAQLSIHVRNEGKRTHAQTNRQKAEGMNVGASDIIVIGSPVFVCELKRKDHTLCRFQDGQLEFLEAAKESGAYACVALGHEAALNAVGEWLSIT